jgi:D-aspartate ligase
MNDSNQASSGRSSVTARANPERAEENWPPAVVAGAYQTGVNLMRNLLRRGVKACAFDANPTQTGFSSRYGKTYLCPNPDTNPESWVSFMHDLAGRIGGKPVLIAAADQFVSAIGTHVDRLKDHFTFLPEAFRIQAQLATKEQQYALAERYGLPTPRTQFIRSSAELREFARTASFPCLIKPLHCREWERMPLGHPLLNQKLATAETPDELIARYESVNQYTPELVVQEIIQGPDNAKFCYMTCFSRKGKNLGACVVRQLRTGPAHFGSATVVEPAIDAEAESVSAHFLESIGYQGLCELELKRDSRDGRIRLIEINPRYSITSDSAPHTGVDIGWLHYLDLIGVDVQPVRQNTHDFRHVVLRRDVDSVRSNMREGLLNWRDLLRSYRRPLHFFDFDIRDRRLSWQTIVEVVKAFLYPYYRRIFPKRGGQRA